MTENACSFKRWVVKIWKGYVGISIVPTICVFLIVTIYFYIDSSNQYVVGLLASFLTLATSYSTLYVTNRLKKRSDDKTRLNEVVELASVLLSELDILSKIGDGISMSSQKFSFVFVTDYEYELFPVYNGVRSKIHLLSDKCRTSVIEVYRMIDLYNASCKQLSAMKTEYANLDRKVQIRANVAKFIEKNNGNNFVRDDSMSEYEENAKWKELHKNKTYYEDTAIKKIYEKLLEVYKVSMSLLKKEIEISTDLLNDYR